MSGWVIAKNTVVPLYDKSKLPVVIAGKLYRVHKIDDKGTVHLFCEDGRVRHDNAGDTRLLSPLEQLALQVDAE